jgi:hypothetical protein
VFVTRILGVLAALGAVVVCLPIVLRKVVVSAFIIFHGLAVISAATSVPPTPWICLMAWSHVFLPYLEATYFTNAYHFYSPQPGPATLLWFYVRYDDGTGRWYKIPNREENALTIEYQRRLSITEYAQQGMEPLAPPPAIREERRLRAGQLDGIPVHAILADSEQYRVPNLYSKKTLASYARRVAHSVPHPTDSTRKPVSVKIYRLFHNFLNALESAAGRDPLDKAFYLPYFMGEYSPDGTLVDPDEPYLYWVIPSVDLRRQAEGIDDDYVLEMVERHAREGSRPAQGVANPDLKQPAGQPVP